MTVDRVVVSPALAAFQARIRGEAGREWIGALPGIAEGYLLRWRLRLDGSARHGLVALVLPVLTADGGAAALRSLTTVEDDLEAVRIIAELLVRLNAYAAPPEVRRLADVVTRMIACVPRGSGSGRHGRCAAATTLGRRDPRCRDRGR